MLNNLLITSDVAGFLADFLDGRTDSSLSGVKLELAKLSTNKHISFEDWWALLGNLDRCLGIPALGLEIGLHIKVQHFGCLGYLLKSSQDLNQALVCFERFQRLLYDGNKATVEYEECTDGMHAFLVWETGYGYSSQLSDELLISGLMVVSATILQDENLRPIRVDFTHAVEKDIQVHYQDFFGCEVRFGQSNLSVGFPADYLALPIVGSDENLHKLLNSQAVSLLAEAPAIESVATGHAIVLSSNSAFMNRVHEILVRSLQQGEPTAEVIAIQLNMSTRTFHRKLKEEGAVFRDVLREVRKILAQQYLLDPKLRLPEVALMLGYSEQSAFSRAFKLWFGKTPLAYKNEGR